MNREGTAAQAGSQLTLNQVSRQSSFDISGCGRAALLFGGKTVRSVLWLGLSTSSHSGLSSQTGSSVALPDHDLLGLKEMHQAWMLSIQTKLEKVSGEFLPGTNLQFWPREGDIHEPSDGSLPEAQADTLRTTLGGYSWVPPQAGEPAAGFTQSAKVGV